MHSTLIGFFFKQYISPWYTQSCLILIKYCIESIVCISCYLASFSLNNVYVFNEFINYNIQSYANGVINCFYNTDFCIRQYHVSAFAVFILLSLQFHIYFYKHIFRVVGGK